MIGNKRILCLLLFAGFTLLLNFNLPGHESSGNMLAAAKKETDILFLKGKFILKDKKGSIVISDDKKPCHCPHYSR